MFDTFEEKLISALKNFNHVLHAIALVIASLMIIWEFSIAVVHSIHQDNLAHEFLQALGTLFIVWTLSSEYSLENSHAAALVLICSPS